MCTEYPIFIAWSVRENGQSCTVREKVVPCCGLRALLDPPGAEHTASVAELYALHCMGRMTHRKPHKFRAFPRSTVLSCFLATPTVRTSRPLASPIPSMYVQPLECLTQQKLDPCASAHHHGMEEQRSSRRRVHRNTLAYQRSNGGVCDFV
jgi:hypothetical protein